MALKTKILKSICFPQRDTWERMWTNMKKWISVEEIQNCRGKQCFAVSSSCFSVLWDYDVKTCQFECIARQYFFIVTENVHGKNLFQTSPSPHIAETYSQRNKPTWITVLTQGLQLTIIHSLLPCGNICISHAEVSHTLQRKRSIKGQGGKGETIWLRQSSDTD